MAVIVVDNDDVIVAGDIREFTNTLSRTGGVYDLTGKTVEANVRKENAPSTVIHASLENLPVTLGNTLVTAANGGVTLGLSAAQTALLSPPAYVSIEFVANHVIQYIVRTDGNSLQVFRFGVRLRLD